MQKKLTRLVIALIGVLIPLLSSTDSLQAMPVPGGNDMTLTSNRGGHQYTTTFKGFNVANATTGAFEEINEDNEAEERTGWTWKKVGDDIFVYDNNGNKVATYHGGAQPANQNGAIEDNPDVAGTFGGNWTRP